MSEKSFSPLVVVGSSAGGLEALSKLVSTLPEDFSAPVIIAQHLDPERFRAAFEQARVGIVQASLDGRVLIPNPGFCQIIGYTEEEARELHVRDFTHPEDYEADIEQGRRVLAGEISGYSMEKRYLCKDGSVVWVNLTSTIVRDTSGEPQYTLAVVEDIDGRKRAEERLRRAAEFDAFRVALSDALRPLNDPLEIRATASRVLGEHLGTDRVYYVEIDEANTEYAVARDWHRTEVPSHARRYPLADWQMPWLLDGKTWVVRDVDSDPAMPDDQRELYRGNDIGAAVVVPLIKEDRLVATLVVNERTPRSWTPHEAALVEETAERAWAAVERARAEEAVRTSEEKYRTLFDSIDAGFCVIEVSFDAEGRPVDYRFLETNSAFEKQTGLEQAAGTWMRELAPQHEEHWFEIYGHVAQTGEPVRFEDRAEALNRWFDVYAYRYGEPASNQVAILFKDITQRKHREANLAFLVEITQDLASLSDIEETMDKLGAKIGEYFDVARSAFCEISEDQVWSTITHEWHRHDMPSMKDVYRVKDFFSEGYERANRAGEIFSIRDTASDERVHADNYAALGVGSMLNVPLIRDGQWRFTLALLDSKPRDWRDDEIELMRELTTRIWTRLEHARAEEALRESEARFRRVFSNNMEAMAIWKQSGEITDANNAMLDLIGYSREELEAGSLDWRELTPPEYRDKDKRAVAEVEAHGVCTPYEKEFIGKDGRRVPVLIGGGRFDERSGKGILFAVDLAERKRAEEERERLLAQEWTVRAQAEERRRISRELHDRVAHAMGVVHQSLELYNALKERSPEQAKAKMELARETTREALHTTRNLSRELHDTEAEDGLSAALSNLLKTSVPPGLESSIQVEGDESFIPPRVREQLFLIMREAVRNAVSHAGAGRLSIEVKVSPERVVGRVEDDGRGFEEEFEGDSGASGRGLQSMRERAELIGGTLRLSSTPMVGTKIEASVPFTMNVAEGQNITEGAHE